LIDGQARSALPALTVPTGQGIESHTDTGSERAHPVLRRRLAHGHDKDGALVGGVRRKERSNVIVVERQATGAQSHGAGTQVHLAAENASLQLYGAIAPVPQVL